MQIEPLDLAHQNLLEERFRKLNLSLSEYSFANLYLFRTLHCYEAIHIEDEIFIRGMTRDKTSFIMLTSAPEDISDSLLLQILPLAEIVYPIPDDWLELLKMRLEKLGFLHNVYYREDENDYIYRRNILATYPGRHLDGKRNLIKQLLSHHKAESHLINEQIKDCETILSNWQKGRQGTSEETDYFSCLEALNNFNRLRLSGTIVYVDDLPAGFTLGERISNDCYAIHFSKGASAIRGLHQYLIKESARVLEETCEWINLEQDLGISTLKDSKLSYHPTFMLKKWRIRSFLKSF